MSDWQFNCKKVKERGAEILNSGQWADCSFLVGSGTDKARFRAHKLFLAMTTPVFDAMLNGPMAEQKDDIEIPDIKPDAFRAMLEYIYTDKINIQTCLEAQELYLCAKKYLLPYLVEGIIDYLRDKLTTQNLFPFLQIGHMFDEISLLEVCYEIIRVNTKEFLNDPKFLEIELSLVQRILRLSPLNIDSELDLYFAVEKYVKHAKTKDTSSDENQCGSGPSDENNTSPDSSKEAKKKRVTSTKKITSDVNMNEQFGDKDNAEDINNKIFRCLIPAVELLTLSPRQFVNHIANSPYIAQSEKYDLMMNIGSSDTSIPVPKNFNPNRELRRPKLDTNPQHNRDEGENQDPNRAETMFIFDVPSFSVKHVMSSVFFVRGLPWRIGIAIGNKERNEYNEIRQSGLIKVCCCKTYSVKPWSCRAKCIVIYTLTNSIVETDAKAFDHVFTSEDHTQSVEVILTGSPPLQITLRIVAQEPIYYRETK